jgi:hypothetical protein
MRVFHVKVYLSILTSLNVLLLQRQKAVDGKVSLPMLTIGFSMKNFLNTEMSSRDI